MITPQAAIRAAFGIAHDRAGNLPAMSGILPDQRAPIVRAAEGEWVMALFRWGIPGPKKHSQQTVKTAA